MRRNNVPGKSPKRSGGRRLLRDVLTVFGFLMIVCFIVLTMFLEQSGFWEANRFRLPPERPIEYAARYLGLKYPDRSFVFMDAEGEQQGGQTVFHFAGVEDEGDMPDSFPYTISITKEFHFKYHAVDNFYRSYVEERVCGYLSDIFRETGLVCESVVLDAVRETGLHAPADISTEDLLAGTYDTPVRCTMFLSAETGGTVAGRKDAFMQASEILQKQAFPGIYYVSIEENGTVVLEGRVDVQAPG